jgi:AcrR family transcriptional regulator
MPTKPPAQRPTGEPGSASTEPPWRQRAIDRSTQPARDRVATRVERFLNSAREIIAEKGSIEFTVQEVVDRSQQSLRSFYQYFDGKDELLLALFEAEMEPFINHIRDSTATGDPLDRLRKAVLLLYELSAPGRISTQPVFADFAQRLIIDHPDDVTTAYAPVVEYIASIAEAAAAEGLLRPGRPHRMATIVLQTATVMSGRSVGGRQPITGDEVWEFCVHAIVPDQIAADRYPALAAGGA